MSAENVSANIAAAGAAGAPDALAAGADLGALGDGVSRDGLKVTIPPKTVDGNTDDWSPEVVKIDRQLPRSTTKDSDRHQTPLRTRPSSTGKVRNMGDAGPSGAQRLLGRTPVTGEARINLLHEDAEMRNRRLEVMRQEADGAHSFQPTVNGKPGRPSESGTDVFNKLYQAAEAQTQRLAEKTSAQSSGEERERRMSTPESQRDFQQRLAESDARLQAKLKQRVDADQRQFDEDCTFQPKLVSTQRSKSASRAARGPRANVQARLMMYLDSQEDRRRQLEEEAAERFAAETTFHPNVKMPAGLEVEEAEMNTELTFQPHLPRSGSPARRSSKPVFERLHEDSNQRSTSRTHRDRRDSAARSNGAMDSLTRSQTDDTGDVLTRRKSGNVLGSGSSIFDRLNQEAEAREQKQGARNADAAAAKRPDSGTKAAQRRDATPLRARGSSRGRTGSLARAGSQSDNIKSLRRTGSQGAVDGEEAACMSPKAGEDVDGSLEELNASNDQS